MKSLVRTLALCSFALVALACSGSSDHGQTGNEADVTSCGPATTLTCAKGFVLATDQCPAGRARCVKQSCLNPVCSDEENCDNTGGMWLDDDPNPKTGLYCDCPSGKTWEAGKGCVAGSPIDHPTCLTLTCAAGYHCCSGPPTAPGSTPSVAKCYAAGLLCPL
jgi:hypothetical protein